MITATTDGGVIWRRYGDRTIVVTYGDETPDEALARIEREKANRELSAPMLPGYRPTVAGIGVQTWAY